MDPSGRGFCSNFAGFLFLFSLFKVCASRGSRDAGFCPRVIGNVFLCKCGDELSIARRKLAGAQISVRVRFRVRV